MMCRLLIGISPAEKIAIFPWTCGHLKSEWQPTGIKPAGNDDGRNADHVDPSGVAVRAASDGAIFE